MTGAQFKTWAKSQGYVGRQKLEDLADQIGVGTTTLYNRFRDAKLDKTFILALAQVGCEPAKNEAQKAS